jgi:multiple sugar transport system permease protein
LRAEAQAGARGWPDLRRAGGRRPVRKTALRRRIVGIGLLVPALLFSFTLVLTPIVNTVWMSLHDMNLSRPARMYRFTGLLHYENLLSDERVWRAVLTTLLYSSVVTAGACAIGLGLALLVNKRTPGVWIARTLLALPWAIPGVVAAFIFMWIFDTSFGVVNYWLLRSGTVRQAVPWASYPETAMILISLVGIWKIVPFVMLAQLAGLQAIPDELYQAARVDGANRRQEFRHVTWPALTHVRVVTVILTGLVTFREFGQIFVITGGGPERSTETLSVKIYIEAFQNFQFGYASALGVLMVLISLSFTIGVKRSMGGRAD